MRIDRFVTLQLVSPLQTLKARLGLRVPILMYHSISDRHVASGHPYFETTTTPEVFARHMQHLFERGYRVVSLSAAAEILRQRQATQAKALDSSFPPTAVITFDDGFLDFYTNARPILERYSFAATVFLPTGFISETRRAFKDIVCLNWAEVRELRSAGFCFGSHTVTHPHLHILKRSEVEKELKSSKETIENELGEPVATFSYPYAFPDGDIKFVDFLGEILKSSGYKCGVTTRIGTSTPKDPPLFLKRIPVNSWDDVCLLDAKLRGAYDWLGLPQYALKRMKGYRYFRDSQQIRNR
jgi:peptidoglycan/xylan/chitin deacetylase (PgdA/CDA1 family)